MNTWHIHIEGQVQGVGFRPFVFAVAQKMGLKGWVNNTVDGVHIVFNAEKNVALEFTNKIAATAPSLSKITAIRRFKIQQKTFDDFQIIHSESDGEAKLLLTPDFALCEDCRKELHQTKDRRYRYSFITCTNCGPRYSIVHQLPYDRINTTMDAFQMCPVCLKEYNTPSDRRYYSQTNSCSDCGIELTLYDAKQVVVSSDSEKIIEQIIHYWEAGKIVAIKGIGGYLLTCDAENSNAVLALRKRKFRPSKPFAVMYPNSTALNCFAVNKEAIQELNNHVSPILLLEQNGLTNLVEEIAPGLKLFGVMLPYTPLYELLLRAFGKPIVATSGNISNSPIIYSDEKALAELPKIADYILVNNRKIVVPQDDSVIKYSSFKNHRIILRRSRGLAPTYINANLKLPALSIVAMGAMLKSTFSLLHRGNTYTSQYLGDLEHFDTQQNFQHTVQHFLNLFHVQPEVILIDKHPEYPSSQFGEQLAHTWGSPVIPIQHHIAHFGAVLGEHNLIESETPVLGVIWDGTGLGEDGQIWGGEFFKYEKHEFQRCHHFDYFDFILGDKMPREPRISALSACWYIKGAEEHLKHKFSATEWPIYSTIMKKRSRLQTSSVGRIFDAVASLLGIMDKQTYEGEAAMRLEALATSYFKQHGLDFSSSYFPVDAHFQQIPTKSLMAGIIRDLNAEKATDFIAAKFHYSLVRLIVIIANKMNIQSIAFSGGVFQNSLLVDLILHHLKNNFELYFHKELSPNDENVSFGQLVCYQINKQKESLIKHKSNHYVFSDSR